MALTKIRGSSQIVASTVTETEIATSTLNTNSGLTGFGGTKLSVSAGAGISVTSSVAVDQAYNFVLTHASAPITISNAAARVAYSSTPTFTGADTLALVTKGYVDATAQGLSVKTAVRAATTGPLTLASDFEDGDTLDTTVTLATGDRILIKDQAAPAENGIYVVNLTGAPTRALDMDVASEFAGSFTFVQEGTSNQDTGWVCTTDNPITVGTTAITFAQFSAAGVVTASLGLVKVGNDIRIASSAAGAGLTLTTGVLDVGGTTNRISVSASAVDIDANYVGQSSITTVGTLTTGSTGAGFTIALSTSTISGTLTVPNGGTGATSLTANGIIYGNGVGAVQVTTAANNSVLITSGGGVPSLSTTLPTAVQGNITSTGTLTSGATGAGYTVALGTSNVTGTVLNQLIVGGTSGTPVKTLFKGSNTASAGTTITITGLTTGTLYKVYRGGNLEIAGAANYVPTANTLTNTTDPFIAGEEILVEQIQ